MVDRSGQSVVILGAAGGLGFGLASRFAKDGAKVVLSDIEAPALIDATEKLLDQGLDVYYVQTDVAQSQQVDSLAETVLERSGKVDIVCNAVGVAIRGTTWGISYEDWRWVIDVNLFGVINTIRSFVPNLIDQNSGQIIITASTVALASSGGSSAYFASKHAVLSVCESLQHDLRAGNSDVKVAVFIPGTIRSSMYDAMRNRQEGYGGPGHPCEEDLTAARSFMSQHGTDPLVLADTLVEQLDEGSFYAFGRISDARLAEARVSGILSRTLPSPVIMYPSRHFER